MTPEQQAAVFHSLLAMRAQIEAILPMIAPRAAPAPEQQPQRTGPRWMGDDEQPETQGGE